MIPYCELLSIIVLLYMSDVLRNELLTARPTAKHVVMRAFAYAEWPKII